MLWKPLSLDLSPVVLPPLRSGRALYQVQNSLYQVQNSPISQIRVGRSPPGRALRTGTHTSVTLCHGLNVDLPEGNRRLL